MLRSILIFILLSFLLNSCKVYEENDIDKYDLTGLLDDSVKTKDSTHTVYSFPDKYKITKSNLLVGSRFDKNNKTEVLKIVEIQNTKVIKQGNNLSEGRIVYKIPNVMKIRSTYKIIVRISKSKATVSLYDSLQGNVMTSKIPVTETMEVKLIDLSPSDNKSFHIADGNSGVQIIEDGDTYTEWSWSVTPLIVGNSKLKIVVSVIRDNNKKDIVYEDVVEVEKDVLVQILFFLKKYWQVLMTSIALPFIIWIYKRIKEKKEKSNESKI